MGEGRKGRREKGTKDTQYRVQGVPGLRVEKCFGISLRDLFEEMEQKDIHSVAIMYTRKMMIHGLDWEIKPAEIGVDETS